MCSPCGENIENRSSTVHQRAPHAVFFPTHKSRLCLETGFQLAFFCFVSLSGDANSYEIHFSPFIKSRGVHLHGAASHYHELPLPFKRRVVSVRKRISSHHILSLSPYRTRGCISGIIWFKEVRKNFSRGLEKKIHHKCISEYGKKHL